VNISASEKGDNRGSSAVLVHYLDKEDRRYTGQQRETWFNGIGKDHASYAVRAALDANVAKLCQRDAKFFLVNISPSQREIAFLLDRFGDRGAREALQRYTIKLMDAYALNFRKEKITSNQDLLWFGKVERHRYYTHRDSEVKEGLAEKGTPKPGLQLHVQVVVSRKDRSNTIRLSPMNNSRGRNSAHSAKMGQFDRSAFKQAGEMLFDELFGFQRSTKETFLEANRNHKLREPLDRDGFRRTERKGTDGLSWDDISQKAEGLLELLMERQELDPLAPQLQQKNRKRRKKGRSNPGLNR